MKEIAVIIEKDECCHLFRSLENRDQLQLMEGIQKVVRKIWKENEENPGFDFLIDGGIKIESKIAMVTLNFKFKDERGLVRVEKMEIFEQVLMD